MTAVAAALVDREHRVTAYTGATYADAFDELGCETVLWRDAHEIQEQELMDALPAAGEPGARGSQSRLHHLFLDTAMSQVEDILAAHERHPFDALVGDVMSVGTGLAAELLGLPWATLSLVPLTMPSRDLPPPGMGLQPGRGITGRLRDRLLRAFAPPVGERADREYRALRAQLGLQNGRHFAEAIYSRQLVIATGSASLEFPRSDLPARVEFVGHLQPRASTLGAPPLWAETLALEPRPIVVVTQGLVDTDPVELLEPTLFALTHEQVRVIGTTAGRSTAEHVPANARLVDFVPFSAVLPHATVGVTNGGWGGVLEMLAAGVPLVVAGGTLDKPEIAARVAWSGAGLDLRTGRPRPIRVRNAVRRVLQEPAFRERAQVIAAEFAALGGAERAAALVEELLAPRPEQILT
ncbi:nucleotide disphospho-sugar-binding domain-containing protein [Agrococcus sp. KRD186]|uniref:nucleotide disphospho-sugar-binding domain-containing protein n=1 Tax=Agrococcus sp. KRD186 TaxID=2729730 RepID=UPI0019D0EADF